MNNISVSSGFSFFYHPVLSVKIPVADGDEVVYVCQWRAACSCVSSAKARWWRSRWPTTGAVCRGCRWRSREQNHWECKRFDKGYDEQKSVTMVWERSEVALKPLVVLTTRWLPKNKFVGWTTATYFILHSNRLRLCCNRMLKIERRGETE